MKKRKGRPKVGRKKAAYAAYDPAPQVEGIARRARCETSAASTRRSLPLLYVARAAAVAGSTICAPHATGSFLLGVADAYAEDTATARKGTASSARHAFRPGGTPATGIAVPGGERPATTGAYLGHHLHTGPRTSAGSAAQLTKQVLGDSARPDARRASRRWATGNRAEARSLVFPYHVMQCDTPVPLCSPVCSIAVKVGRLDRR